MTTRKEKPRMPAVDAQRLEERHRVQLILRQRRNERGHAPVSNQQTGGAANEGKQNRFGEQLPDHTPPTRSERRANRNLFLARQGPRQQEARDVCTRDQQHKGNRSQQHEQDRADGADNLFLSGTYPAQLCPRVNPCAVARCELRSGLWLNSLRPAEPPRLDASDDVGAVHEPASGRILCRERL